MVVVDAHSKWPEVHLMSSTTTFKTIQVLRGLFSRYGLPEVLVSDNGPQFTSSEFDTFMKGNGSETHTLCAIPPSHEWASRTLCANLQALTETLGRDNVNSTQTGCVPVDVSQHSALNNQGITSHAVHASQAAIKT